MRFTVNPTLNMQAGVYPISISTWLPDTVEFVQNITITITQAAITNNNVPSDLTRVYTTFTPYTLGGTPSNTITASFS